MAETIVSLLLEKVASFAQDEILKAATVKVELEKLKAKLKTIQPIVRDAHNKQFFSKEVKDWVWRVNDIVYDALDVIELYQVKSRRAADPIDSLRSKVLKKTLNSVTNFHKKIRLLHKIGTKIKEINERLNVIYKEKDQYGLVPMLKESSSLGDNLTVLMQDRQTTSAIKETSIIGREEDEEVLIKWLSEESNPDEDSASVIAIIGMGGLGKTALAQNIYHKCSEQGCFDKCMWVCVAEMPKVLDLLKKILDEVEGERSCSNQLTSANTIHSRISNYLKNTNFLLVLDDVWDYGWWDELRSIWQHCGSGSKVLITTRQVQVAQAMGLTHSHELKCLNEEQSWHLFLNKALRRGESEEHLSAVKDVGRDIATKCGGLPLALSAVGSLLRQKERRKCEWQNVLHSPLWNWQGLAENNSRVFAAIALSYMNIPYQLKQCLTYFCMYPKDYGMKKADLVRLWVAEGFVLKEVGVEIEVTAKRCLDTLVGCSLVQDAGDEHYKLHDIVHDFGLHVRQKEYVSISQLKNELISHHARYLSSFGGECSSEALRRQDKLRGLICLHTDCPYNFDAFRWLRVLDLSRGTFSALPESIGDLILLKYINLSLTKIFELPESITKLSELQTLDLSDSDIKRLPNKISALAALRHLDISGTWKLEYLPHGIGKLTSLQTLPKFVVSNSRIGDWMGSSLLDLCELNNLKGSLIIEHLEKVDNIEEADHAQLKRKGNLQSLGLRCDSRCMIEFNKDVIEKVEQVYERMQPPTVIEEISIYGYPGMKCPTWMSSSTYSSIREIFICECAFLEGLPNLGILPNLVDLKIVSIYKVKVLDFTLDHVGKKITFPKLQALRLGNMKSLEEWHFDGEIRNMPCLRRLYIDECPKLKVIPSFSTLEDLMVINMAEWEGWFMANERDMPCLKKLRLLSCHKLKLLPNCPWLEELLIESCDQLVELPVLSPVLVSATIKYCPSISYGWNIEAYEAKELKHLEIVDCPKLESLLQGLQCGNLKMFVIADCLHLTSIPTATGLKSLCLRNLPQLEFQPVVFLDSMSGLEELHLGHKLGSLQVEELLARLDVRRLKRLKLSGLQELGVEWLKSKIGGRVMLKELLIEDCPKVRQSIIDVLKEGTLPKLHVLSLASFPSSGYRTGYGFDVGYRASSGCKRCATDGQLACNLVIDSLEMSDELAGLILHLSCKVRSLAVSVLPEVDSLPEWIQQLHQLEELTIFESPQLTHLPHWLNKLPQLFTLILHDLPELVELPTAIEDLHQLALLEITKCPNLRSVPHGLSRLPRLQLLRIVGCPLLAEWCRKEDRNIISSIRHVIII